MSSSATTNFSPASVALAARPSASLVAAFSLALATFFVLRSLPLPDHLETIQDLLPDEVGHPP